MSRAAAIRAALAHGHTIDITTTGRHSGQPRRIAIGQDTARPINCSVR